jgi:hypothetical protein
VAHEEDPMPVFTLKAKDALALDMVNYYEWLCCEAGLTDQAVEVRKAFREIEEWRVRNASAVKMPDHPHVPAQTTFIGPTT